MKFLFTGKEYINVDQIAMVDVAYIYRTNPDDGRAACCITTGKSIGEVRITLKGGGEDLIYNPDHRDELSPTEAEVIAERLVAELEEMI